MQECISGPSRRHWGFCKNTSVLLKRTLGVLQRDDRGSAKRRLGFCKETIGVLQRDDRGSAKRRLGFYNKILCKEFCKDTLDEH